MNNRILMARLSVVLIWCSVFTTVIHQARAGVFLTVNPSSITNDYNGKIVFTVTGLTDGQKLIISRYSDGNSNGIAEANEIVPGAFSVADGRLPRIGGVRNINVPGDEDGITNGEVRVELFYPGLDKVLDSAPGNYLIRVTDTNLVQLDIKPFTILPKTYPQGVRGRATSATTGLPLTNAFVILMTMPESNGGNGVTADADGNYTIFCPAGDYMLGALLPGFVTPFGVSMATVTAGEFVTNNLTAEPATLTVAGRVSDSGNSNGIGGVMVQAESDSGLFAFTSTDSSGSYLIGLVPDGWKIGFSSESLTTHGYVKASGLSTNLSNSVAGLNFQVEKANALIYGNVWDDLGDPVPGVALYANDMATDASGATLGSNADYAIGVLAGDWWAGPSGDDLSALGYSAQGTNVTVGINEAMRVDFTLRRVSAHLIGQAVDDSGAVVSNFGIGANNWEGGNAYVETDSNGNFDFGVFEGTWHLQLDYQRAQQQGFLVTDLSIDVADGETRTNIIYIARRTTAQVSGHVRNNTGNPLANIGVWGSLNLNGTNYNQNATTDGSGYYQFGVINGVWAVGLQCETVMSLGYPCSNNQSLTNSGANQTLDIVVYSPVPLQVGHSGTSLTLSWPAGSGNLQLQESTNVSVGGWWPVFQSRTTNNGNISVTVPSDAGSRFYRLSSQ